MAMFLDFGEKIMYSLSFSVVSLSLGLIVVLLLLPFRW